MPIVYIAAVWYKTLLLSGTRPTLCNKYYYKVYEHPYNCRGPEVDGGSSSTSFETRHRPTASDWLCCMSSKSCGELLASPCPSLGILFPPWSSDRTLTGDHTPPPLPTLGFSFRHGPQRELSQMSTLYHHYSFIISLGHFTQAALS